MRGGAMAWPQGCSSLSRLGHEKEDIGRSWFGQGLGGEADFYAALAHGETVSSFGRNDVFVVCGRDGDGKSKDNSNSRSLTG
jgi:hypothetical protein